MRQHLATLVVGLVAIRSASADNTKPTTPKSKATAIDAKAVADKLDVFHDEFGAFYVSPKPAGFKDSDTVDSWVFYGDGKTMYRQIVVGSSTTSSNQYSWQLWSPRVRSLQNAKLELTKGSLFVECKLRDGKRPLTQLSEAETTAFFARATFLPVLWQREAHFLARDDDGVYYYVDALKESAGGSGYRVFVGQKGSMKELAMSNVVSDTAGEIFATKTGELKIVTTDANKAYWKKGGKKTELVVLELFPNRYLIYRELGIYGQLGVACEDQ